MTADQSELSIESERREERAGCSLVHAGKLRVPFGEIS